ncbi:MAG: A/G-specific adenine glycosylase [Pelovirga sp.]
MPDLPFATAPFARALLDWYDHSGRDLPWRNTRDPYRIWLSEIMLQQTTVAAVLTYYERFLARFPTLVALAEAPLEEVIDQWAGLGYYSRARNLHAAAGQVVARFGGVFPGEVQQLQELPGIGRSTAGAIAALAFDQPAAILDANVRRVLCRLFALRQPARSSMAEKQLWHWAEALLPATRLHDYTQAMMDLGAMVCLPRQPLCPQCPVHFCCQAAALGIQEAVPVGAQKKPIPVRHEAVLLLHCHGRYQVRRRPVDGFLGGLWEFPAVGLPNATPGMAAVRQYLLQSGLTGDVESLGRIRHSYSHFHLEAEIFRVVLPAAQRTAEADGTWKTVAELLPLALHGAHRKVLEKLSQ